ncbi:MAG: DUF305 domain-containing protein [Egibacteraceae bacterium]
MNTIRLAQPTSDGCERARRQPLRWVALVLACVFVLAGCARTDQPGPGDSADRASEETFNDADIEFLRDMISRQDRAVAMAEIVSDRTDRAELVAFSATVVKVRDDEVQTLRGLLADAGENAPSGQDGDDRAVQLPGIVSDVPLWQLADRRDEEFDRAFLDLMKTHARAAVETSERVLDEGESPAVAELAARIIDTRQDELAQIEHWGHQWHLLDSVPPVGLGHGDRGEQVLALEQRLEVLRFDVGQVDDVYDANTVQAVVAFQKLAGLPPSGRASPEVVDRLSSAQPPEPLVAGGGPVRVEIDLPRQVLFLYQDDRLFRILPVSTGSGERFCDEGECGLAETPPGAFRVSRRISGWRTSSLGRLFNPLYFNEGIAIHGFPTVPPQPASHGCVRIPMSSATWFPEKVPDGTPVYVVDGKTPITPLQPASAGK